MLFYVIDIARVYCQGNPADPSHSFGFADSCRHLMMPESDAAWSSQAGSSPFASFHHIRFAIVISLPKFLIGDLEWRLTWTACIAQATE